MDIQKDFLICFVAPLVVSVALMMFTRPWKRDELLLWMIPLIIGAVYPIALHQRLGATVWPMNDSLDRLIAIIPAMLFALALAIAAKLKPGVGLPYLALLFAGALVALGMRKITNEIWSVTNLAIWIAGATIITFAISFGVAEFVKRDDSMLMPILLAGTSLGVAGYVSFTGAITLGTSALPFAGAMTAVLVISGIRRKSALTPLMAAGLVNTLAVFLVASLWWTTSSTSYESIGFLILPLFAWLRFAPKVEKLRPTARIVIIVILTASIAAAAIGRRKKMLEDSLEETGPAYDLGY